MQIVCKVLLIDNDNPSACSAFHLPTFFDIAALPFDFTRIFDSLSYLVIRPFLQRTLI